MNPNPHELAAPLLARGRAGIELAPHPTDAGRLRHRPADLPPDLSARLRIHRAAELGLLVNGLGMRAHAGLSAWLVAVAESMEHSCLPTTTLVHSRHGKTCGCDPGSG